MHPIVLLLLLTALTAGALLVLRTFRQRWQAHQQGLDLEPAILQPEALSNASFAASQKNILDTCNECGACVRHCAFLNAYGTPRALLLGISTSSSHTEAMAFECSLCGLCAAVCPQQLDPGSLFLSMRRQQVARGHLQYSRYRAQLIHEQWGTSALLSWYGLPKGCTTVFFPGCALPGSRPGAILQIVADLRRMIPTLGIVLDCCMKASHDLGRAAAFHSSFTKMHRFLIAQGVYTIVTTCPNCTVIFRHYAPEMTVRLVYELLGAAGRKVTVQTGQEISLHDPCPLRGDAKNHKAIRKLLVSMGYTPVDMPHSGRLTLCCGEGGSVRAIRPEFANHWASLRQQEARGRLLVTSCAGCARFLGRLTPTVHLVDLLYPSDPPKNRQLRSAGPRFIYSFTYWNRLLLKHRVQKIIDTMSQKN